jgi:hypothetical protein
MALARVWDEEWSPREEYERHLRVVETVARPLRTGITVHRRRAARERMMRRRRRALLVAAAVLSLVVLAWPGHAFGGVTGSGVSVDRGGSSVLDSGMVYVVRPGDSVTTIARLVNPWDPAAARRSLRRELHSSVVVPGEHVLVP